MADEYNFQLTSYLLETFNNIINYQYAENPNLVYSIVLHHDYFEKLEQLTFEGAVAEVERVRQLRESKEVERAEQTTETAAEAPPSAAAASPIAETKVEEETEAAPATDDTTSLKSTENHNENGSSDATELPQKEDDTKKEEPKPTYASVTASTSNNQEEETKKKKPEPIQVTPIRQDSMSNSSNVGQVRPSRNGFIPTEAWLSYWKSSIPLGTIMAMLKYLVPKVEEKCAEGNNTTLEELILFLKSIQLEDVLPADESKSIFIRKFQWGEALVIWFRSMMWGQNYVSSMKEHGAWNGTHVKLFQIKEE